MSFDSDLMQIQDICEKVCSGGTPSTRNKEFYIDGTIPWIKTKEVNNCKIFSAETHITEEALAKSSAKLIPENSVIIAMYGNGDTAGRVAINKIPVATNQACCNLIVEPTKADYRFVFYYLRTQYQKLVDLKNGGAQQNLNAKLLKEYPFPNVPRAKQTDIADFLEQLDDKIALNTQTNQTLEQIAQAIFTSWFVDFDPVKAKVNGEQPEGMDAATASLFPDKLAESQVGLIPEGWSVNQLSDICKNHSQSYDLKSVDEVVFVNTGDVLEGDFLHKDYSPVVGLPGQAKKAIKEDDILYSEIRPKNKRFAYVDFDVSDYVVSTKFMVIQANEKVHPRLLYMMLTRQNTIDEFNVIADSRSGTFPQITFKAISNLEFCMAPRKVQDAFVAQVMPMIQLQRSLKTENKRLAELRDTLLPKLLSGEIELGQAQELAEVE